MQDLGQEQEIQHLQPSIPDNVWSPHEAQDLTERHEPTSKHRQRNKLKSNDLEWLMCNEQISTHELAKTVSSQDLDHKNIL